MALFKKDKPQGPPSDPEALQRLLNEVREEKKHLETTIAAAQQAGQVAGDIGKALDQAEARTRDVAARLSDLEQMGASIGDLESRLSMLVGRLGEIETTHRESVTVTTELGRAVSDMREHITELAPTLTTAQELKSELDGLGGPAGAIGELRRKLEELRDKFLDYNHDVTQVRDDQVSLAAAQEEIQEHIEQMRVTATKFRDEVLESKETVARIEVSVQEVAKVQETARTLDRDLKSLTMLADQVLQKTRTVEQQREIVERAESQRAKLDELVWDLDKRIQHVTEEGKRIKKTQDRLTD
ncbi:MAG: hypothetical protein ACE5FJ_00510 [Gemmatimonadales bacterium]